MDVHLQPLGSYVVAVTEEAKTKTASGIWLPPAAVEKPKVAKVVAVGKEVKAVKVGDRIIYEGYKQTDVKVENIEYVLVKEEYVLATVK